MMLCGPDSGSASLCSLACRFQIVRLNRESQNVQSTVSSGHFVIKINQEIFMQCSYYKYPDCCFDKVYRIELHSGSFYKKTGFQPASSFLIFPLFLFPLRRENRESQPHRHFSDTSFRHPSLCSRHFFFTLQNSNSKNVTTDART